MGIDLKTYRITLVLYLSMFLLPVSFIFSYSYFDEIGSDTQKLGTLSSTSSEILYLTTNLKEYKKLEMINTIDNSLKSLKPWILSNEENIFYVASEPLLQKYNNVLHLWNDSKSLEKDNLVECWKASSSLIFSLQNMLKLKQNKMKNIFYLNLIVAVALLILFVFFTRAFIHKELMKQNIYDIRTNLFTKEYLFVTIKELSARVLRNKEILFVLCINIKLDLELSKQEKEKIIESLSKSLLASVRVSDIACQYSESEFIVLLPNTSKVEVEYFIKRMDKYFFDVEHTFKAIEHLHDETYEDFIEKLFKER